MAKNMDDLRKEFEQLKKEYQSLFRGDQIPFKDMSKQPEEANRQIEFFKNGIVASKREASGLSGVFNDLNKQLRANLSELDKSNNSINLGKKAYRQLTDVARELADEEVGIGRVSFSNLKKLDARNESNLKSLNAAAKQLRIDKGIKTESDLRAASAEQLTDSERALLAASFQNFELENRAQKAVTRRLELERNVLDTVKLTGGALNGIGNLASSLGLSGFAESLEEIKTDLDDKLRKKIRDAAIQDFNTNNSNAYKKSLDKINDEKERLGEIQAEINKNDGVATDAQKSALAFQEHAVEKAKDELEAHEEGVQALYKKVKAGSTLVEKFQALGSAAKEFAKQLSDPLVLIGGMVKGYLATDKAATDFQRTTGQNVRAIAGQNSALVSSSETLELMNKFAEQTNLNLNNLFSPQQVGELAEAAKMLGIGAEGGANLAQNLKLSGGNIDDFNEGALSGAKSIVAAGGAGINLGKVLKDTANTSQEIALSLGSNPASIAKANAAAQRLGLTLEQIDGIAGSMLDFESSIQNELEAQLLTGKNINLSKAREAALNNDLKTLSEEILNNNALSNDFGKSNRIQQESMAKALGMSRKELGNMIALEKLRSGISADVVAEQMNMKKEQLLQIDAQEKFQTAINKLQQSLGPLIDAFIPLLDILLVPIQHLGEMLAKVSQLGPSIREAFNLDKIMESPFGSVLKLLSGVVGGVVTFKLGTALIAWATRGTPFNPMVVTDIKGGGAVSMLKNLFKKGGLSKLLFGTKVGGQFLKGGGRATAGTVKGGIVPTITKFYKNLSTRFSSLFKGMKFFGKFGKVFAKGSVIFTALLVAAEAVTNFFEYGFVKGIEKTLRDNAGAILGTVVGALLAPFTGGLSLIIGPAIGAILDYFDVFGFSKGFKEPAKQEMPTYNSSKRLQDFIIRPGQPPAAFDKGDIVVGLRPGGIQSGGSSDTTSLEKKLDELIDKVANIKGDVFIDGNKAGNSIFAAATNLS